MRTSKSLPGRIHISMDPELKRIATNTAANTGGSVSNLITLALKNYLTTRNKTKKSRNLKTGTPNTGR